LTETLFSGGPEFTSHSCEPNAYMRYTGETGVTLVAIRDIAKGVLLRFVCLAVLLRPVVFFSFFSFFCFLDEHISFAYFTTEWAMESPFKCDCGISPFLFSRWFNLLLFNCH
jgi:hypothetical protein